MAKTIPAGQITVLLHDVNSGDKQAVDRLFAMVYNQLKRTARQVKWQSGDRARAAGGTSLVNEAYVRMVGSGRLSLQDRRHFYRYAAEAMRRIQVDQYRARRAAKRGGMHQHVDGIDLDLLSVEKTDWLSLDAALEKLRGEHAVQYEIVMLHFFAGWEFKEIAEMIGKDPKSVSRYWQAARAFLLKELDDESNR
jgi:RNA polymerase sigma factor (TIGR02999 family)